MKITRCHSTEHCQAGDRPCARLPEPGSVCLRATVIVPAKADAACVRHISGRTEVGAYQTLRSGTDATAHGMHGAHHAWPSHPASICALSRRFTTAQGHCVAARLASRLPAKRASADVDVFDALDMVSGPGPREYIMIAPWGQLSAHQAA